ncbi:hypothetical protein CLK_A0147 (plasmid) [Clostridium botulinum A3 str. Loch Maree]|nr:hypothetical protein CLK_A0147 [Clostridium botulinum A3 str. Loch Maree]
MHLTFTLNVFKGTERYIKFSYISLTSILDVFKRNNNKKEKNIKSV